MACILATPIVTYGVPTALAARIFKFIKIDVIISLLTPSQLVGLCFGRLFELHEKRLLAPISTSSACIKGLALMIVAVSTAMWDSIIQQELRPQLLLKRFQ